MKKSSTDFIKVYKYLMFFQNFLRIFHRFYSKPIVFSISFTEMKGCPSFPQNMWKTKRLFLRQPSRQGRDNPTDQIRRVILISYRAILYYFLMVMPRMRSTPRKIFAAALSASSTVSVWSALRRDTEKETLFLPSPICAPR